MSKEEFNMSLSRDVALFSSPITFSPTLAFFIFFIPSFQVEISVFKSLSNSETDFSSATVLTITPKFLGLIDLIKFINLSLSSLLVIFFEMFIASEKDTKIRYLPAKDSSVVTRGPFVEIGSLTI